jgi:hypothetical protein
LNKNYFFIIFLLFVFIGCGGGGTSSSSTNLSKNSIIEDRSLKNQAIDNLSKVIQKDFNGYKVLLFTDKKLNEQREISKDTKAIYGTINGKSTKALIKINSNYQNAVFIVKVYKGSKLVGQSKKFKLDNNSEFIDFGEITTIK